MAKNIIIGIAGASGSGKTYLANQIASRFGQDIAALIAIDSYYRKQDHLSVEERAKNNYDHPAALELDLLVTHLSTLKCGNAAKIPVYDFSMHTRSASSEEILPRPIIIVEGILAFHQENLRNIFDLRVFVETDSQLCLQRRLSRDVIERGRSEASILSQWETTVLPMYYKYCLPTKSFANKIINGVDITENICGDVCEEITKIAAL